MRAFLTALMLSFLFVLACAATLSTERSAALSIDSTPTGAALSFPAFVPAAPPTPRAPLTLPAESWCEPAAALPCVVDADCPAAPDGTPLRCSRDWMGDSSSRICVATFPPVEVRRWRSARLRVLVDEICSPRDGCDPAQLHAYLTTLAMRESTLRPWKIHRLAADREANARAWRKHAETYHESPAASEPDRWFVGRGYFGANAATVLKLWDPAEIPEALCGEVEATLVHLRMARRMWRRLDAGVSCDGREHHGTAGDAPSWYDVSLANSGSNACPGTEGRREQVRRGFERRARSRGLAPYAEVSEAMLGREIPRDEQVEFASDVRRKMAAVR